MISIDFIKSEGEIDSIEKENRSEKKSALFLH